jgi:hypothetical protein
VSRLDADLRHWRQSWAVIHGGGARESSQWSIAHITVRHLSAVEGASGIAVED